MADQYARTLEKRVQLGRLLSEGMSELDAQKQVFGNDSNAARKINTWKAANVYPFGPVSSPDGVDTGQIPIDLPTRTRTKSPQNTSPTISTELLNQIRTIVQQELTTHKPQIEVVRPDLARTLKTSNMKSFRCPTRLWEMAEAKAKTLNMSLNGVVESLLFQWLDRPEELLKK